MIIYKCAYNIIKIISKVFFCTEVQGRENIPSKGAFIIASNHYSYWDPPLLGVSTSRYFCYMAKAELFKVPVFGSLLRKVRVFPINRGHADRRGIKEALKRLSEGDPLLIFPEGTRKRRDFKGELGFAYLAVKAAVPIIPAAIKEKKIIKSIRHCLPLNSRIKIKIGKPIDFHLNYLLDDRENLVKLTDAVMDQIKELYEELE